MTRGPVSRRQWYDWDTKRWMEEHVQVVVDWQPLAQGNLRVAVRMLDLSRPGLDGGLGVGGGCPRPLPPARDVPLKKDFPVGASCIGPIQPRMISTKCNAVLFGKVGGRNQ